MGLGIHGEPGNRRAPLAPPEVLLSDMMRHLAAGPWFRLLGERRRGVLLVNNLGTTPPLEMAIATKVGGRVGARGGEGWCVSGLGHDDNLSHVGRKIRWQVHLDLNELGESACTAIIFGTAVQGSRPACRHAGVPGWCLRPWPHVPPALPRPCATSTQTTRPQAALQSARRDLGLTVDRLYVGPYMTSLDMAGVSLTVLSYDVEGAEEGAGAPSWDELLQLLDAPTDAPGWPVRGAAVPAPYDPQTYSDVPAPLPAAPQQEAAGEADAAGSGPAGGGDAGAALGRALAAAAEALVAAAPELDAMDAKVGRNEAVAGAYRPQAVHTCTCVRCLLSACTAVGR